MVEIQEKLASVMDRIAGNHADIENLGRLSGGANMESWRFTAGDTVCVLRRAPSLEMMEGRPLDHAAEAALIRIMTAPSLSRCSATRKTRSSRCSTAARTKAGR